MNAITLPIIGTGSQPKDINDIDLNFISLPSEMNVYTKPHLADSINVHEIHGLKHFLNEILNGLKNYSILSNTIYNTHYLTTAEVTLLNEILGNGEVSIIIKQPLKTHIQESVLAGVWRIRQYNESNECITDYVEIGEIPLLIKTDTFSNAKQKIEINIEQLPDGLMNALPLIAELNQHITHYYQPHSINLSLLPQTEQDLAFLHSSLGEGSVSILSRSYGTNRITSTGVNKVWWVQYFNSDDTLILNTLEICPVPIVVCAALEDLQDSQQRLQDIIEHDLER